VQPANGTNTANRKGWGRFMEAYVWARAVAFAICIPAFGALELLWPAHRQIYFFRYQWLTDTAHFFVSYVIARAGLVFFTVLFIDSLQFPGWLVSFRAGVNAQPLWLQFVEILLIVDFLQYWIHRCMHDVPFLWKFHAIHHSPEQLDWLASVRGHPGEELLRRIPILIVLALCGLDPMMFLLYWAGFDPVHATFVHSNVRVKFPGLRWLVVTPETHHWHHAVAPVGKNFAGRLAIWDRMFGTFHMPIGELPTVYGSSEPVPKHYLGQILYPFVSLFSRRGWTEAETQQGRASVRLADAPMLPSVRQEPLPVPAAWSQRRYLMQSGLGALTKSARRWRLHGKRDAPNASDASPQADASAGSSRSSHDA